MTQPNVESAEQVPVFQETIAGSLIDSARISVIAALSLLPPPDAPLIVMPGTEQEMSEDAAASVQGCLEQAMEWARCGPPTHHHRRRTCYVAARRRRATTLMRRGE